MPLGGYKLNGYGREPGLRHNDDFLQVKAIWMNTV